MTFGGFTDGQRFNTPHAAVTVSVSETLYWTAGGAELSEVNASPLISMELDGQAFSDSPPSYDVPSRTFTLTFNGTLEEGDYEVFVARGVVANGYRNTLDAASARFTVAVPVISGMSTNPARLTSAGGYTDAAITGANLTGP